MAIYCLILLESRFNLIDFDQIFGKTNPNRASFGMIKNQKLISSQKPGPILVFSAAANSGKTLTWLGLLKSRPSLFYLRLNNNLKDFQSVKHFFPHVQLLKDEASLFKKPLPEPVIVETQGGVLSLRNGVPQAHQLMTKYWADFSTILVGDLESKQGISNSLLSYEALVNRDFKVDSLILYPKTHSESEHSKELAKFVNVPVVEVGHLPKLKNDPLLDYTNTMVWLEQNTNQFKKMISIEPA